MARRVIAIDEKIEKAEAPVAVAKAEYDVALDGSGEVGCKA